MLPPPQGGLLFRKNCKTCAIHCIFLNKGAWDWVIAFQCFLGNSLQNYWLDLRHTVYSSMPAFFHTNGSPFRFQGIFWGSFSLTGDCVESQISTLPFGIHMVTSSLTRKSCVRWLLSVHSLVCVLSFRVRYCHFHLTVASVHCCSLWVLLRSCTIDYTTCYEPRVTLFGAPVSSMTFCMSSLWN